ncbi:hypothetical protein EB233_28210 [Mesorhizobium erdmanii]|uniref:Uncharacterized protein n=1 Tax=Mesorhizobium erdmanii TaxID=1777866 RepID=A0A6M7UPC1_9HYPH|nr:hypothetical protein A8146_25365 [Mesorhizobium loti]QKC78914.1 hypothetical protein EB233_28210 [Mesorhizobium erdmanii]
MTFLPRRLEELAISKGLMRVKMAKRQSWTSRAAEICSRLLPGSENALRQMLRPDFTELQSITFRTVLNSDDRLQAKA